MDIYEKNIIYYHFLIKAFKQILGFYKIRKNCSIFIKSLLDNGENILFDKIKLWLMCNNKIKEEHCMSCDNCRLVIKNEHPNIYYFNCINNKVELNDLFFNLYEIENYKGNKILCIRYVEYLDDNNLNLLIKLIEKPPKNTNFIIFSNSISYKISRLKSLCFYYTIAMPPKHQTMSLLKKLKYEDNNIKNVMRICYNSPIISIKLLKSQFIRRRNEIFDIIKESILSKNFFLLLSVLNKIEKYVYNNPIYWLLTLILDVIKYNLKINKLINQDRIDVIIVIKKNIKINNLFTHAKILEYIINMTNRNTNFNDYKILITYYLLELKNSII